MTPCMTCVNAFAFVPTYKQKDKLKYAQGFPGYYDQTGIHLRIYTIQYTYPLPSLVWCSYLEVDEWWWRRQK